jgi:hypothetical protein
MFDYQGSITPFAPGVMPLAAVFCFFVRDNPVSGTSALQYLFYIAHPVALLSTDGDRAQVAGFIPAPERAFIHVEDFSYLLNTWICFRIGVGNQLFQLPAGFIYTVVDGFDQLPGVDGYIQARVVA